MITLFTTLWSYAIFAFNEDHYAMLFSSNTMTFMKRKWLGRLEKGYKQMFSQSCWNRKAKEIALFLESLSNRKNHFILGRFGKMFLYHFRGEILNWLYLQRHERFLLCIFVYLLWHHFRTFRGYFRMSPSITFIFMWNTIVLFCRFPSLERPVLIMKSSLWSSFLLYSIG